MKDKECAMNRNKIFTLLTALSLVALLVTAFTSAQAAPSESQSQNHIKSPTARAYTPMAYDSESDRFIIFGGQTDTRYWLPSSYDGETWAYDLAANEWTNMKPMKAPARMGASELAYNSKYDMIIMYGGCDVSEWGKSETWAYDFNKNTWKKMSPGPANHIGARIAYDAESDQIILFGGYDISGSFFNDTWAYDYGSDTWQEMNPVTSPPGRNYQAMTYDSKADRVLTWGGLDINGEYPVDESMWAYDFNTNTWTEYLPNSGEYPAGRDYPQMAYDAESDRTILFGGTPTDGSDTWAYEFESNIWTKMNPGLVPDPLSKHVMAYSAAADRVVLFGGLFENSGNLLSNKTWSYDFNMDSWTNLTAVH